VKRGNVTPSTEIAHENIGDAGRGLERFAINPTRFGRRLV
jgi:hypothetical protein